MATIMRNETSSIPNEHDSDGSSSKSSTSFIERILEQTRERERESWSDGDESDSATVILHDISAEQDQDSDEDDEGSDEQEEDYPSQEESSGASDSDDNDSLFHDHSSSGDESDDDADDASSNIEMPRDSPGNDYDEENDEYAQQYVAMTVAKIAKADEQDSDFEIASSESDTGDAPGSDEVLPETYNYVDESKTVVSAAERVKTRQRGKPPVDSSANVSDPSTASTRRTDSDHFWDKSQEGQVTYRDRGHRRYRCTSPGLFVSPSPPETPPPVEPAKHSPGKSRCINREEREWFQEFSGRMNIADFDILPDVLYYLDRTLNSRLHTFYTRSMYDFHSESDNENALKHSLKHKLFAKQLHLHIEAEKIRTERIPTKHRSSTDFNGFVTLYSDKATAEEELVRLNLTFNNKNIEKKRSNTGKHAKDHEQEHDTSFYVHRVNKYALFAARPDTIVFEMEPLLKTYKLDHLMRGYEPAVQHELRKPFDKHWFSDHPVRKGKEIQLRESETFLLWGKVPYGVAEEGSGFHGVGVAGIGGQGGRDGDAHVHKKLKQDRNAGGVKAGKGVGKGGKRRGGGSSCAIS